MYTNNYYDGSSSGESVVMEKKKFGKNIIADAINIIAIITFACGLVLGVVMLIVLCATGLASLLWLAFILWVSAGVAGFMLMGFAQVINLLTDIRNNQIKK